MDENTQIPASTVEADTSKDVEPSQESKGKTEAEKAAFSLKKNAERARELGVDVESVLGTKTHIETGVDDEDSKPVTVGMLRDIQKKDAQKSAIQMADDIADEDTRTTVKSYLADNIKPSGNAESDFRIALAAASATKNKQVIEEINRYTPPKRTASGGSIPANLEEAFTPTAEEQRFMQPPYNLSQAKVLAARKAHADKQQ